MTRTTIFSALLALVLLVAGASEAFAWSKNFPGTRDQVRAACVGADREVFEGSGTTSCRTGNGTVVTCNNEGNCAGTGPGPAPRTNVSDVIGAIVGASTGTKAPAAGDTTGLPKPGTTGHIGNGNPGSLGSEDIGQWHAAPGDMPQWHGTIGG